jgi:Domain of unknown function (DUF5925)/ATPase family associated with various cellular activities (AAA)
VTDLLPGHPLPRAAIWLDRLDEIPTALLLSAQLDGGMPYHRAGRVPGTVGDPTALVPAGAQLRLDQQQDGARTVVVAWPGLLAAVEVRHKVTTVDVVGADLAAVERVVEHVTGAAREVSVLPEGAVRMRFWSFVDGSGDMSTRQVAAPTWEEAVGNYARRTAVALGRLMTADDVPARAGRLILWHGAPGTGKTTAVRALAREWSGWCRPHYVMDPEKLFAEPQYLLELAGAHESGADEHWRLVIAEDCDEYLSADAKERAGASLGRLLNLCDGILGHGLRVLVLLTTNEDVGRLHPAITRPGRCLSSIEFEPLRPAEARTWLGAGVAAPEAPMTLAQLFALKEQRADTGVPPEPGVGGYL